MYCWEIYVEDDEEAAAVSEYEYETARAAWHAALNGFQEALRRIDRATQLRVRVSALED